MIIAEIIEPYHQHAPDLLLLYADIHVNSNKDNNTYGKVYIIITKIIINLCPKVISLSVNNTHKHIAIIAQNIAILAYLDCSEPINKFVKFIV